ncbi:hypothetical protein ES706_04160 [subsurface metagenome]
MPLERREDLSESWSKHDKTADQTREFHALYLKAVNHPIRRAILEIVNQKPMTEEELLEILKEQDILNEKDMLKYHLDFLEKGYCIKKINDQQTKKILYKITQEGTVVDYLDK